MLNNTFSPVGLIAQLVEHCTGIAEVYGTEFRSGLNFFQALFCCVYNYGDQSCLHVYSNAGSDSLAKLVS